MSNGACEPAGALHLEDNPIQAEKAFTDAGVDVVSISQTTACTRPGIPGAQATGAGAGR